MKKDSTITLARLDRSKTLAFNYDLEQALTDELVSTNNWRSAKNITINGSLIPLDDGWELLANLQANIVLTCVISGAPITYNLNFPVRRVYIENYQHLTEDYQWDSDLDVDKEPLPKSLSLQHLISEAVLLELPEYPKVEEYNSESHFIYSTNENDPTESLEEKPFANLKKMIDDKKRKET